MIVRATGYVTPCTARVYVNPTPGRPPTRPGMYSGTLTGIFNHRKTGGRRWKIRLGRGGGRERGGSGGRKGGRGGARDGHRRSAQRLSSAPGDTTPSRRGAWGRT